MLLINHTGLARGYVSAADLEPMHVHLYDALARHGVMLDAIYHLPAPLGRHGAGAVVAVRWPQAAFRRALCR